MNNPEGRGEGLPAPCRPAQPLETTVHLLHPELNLALDLFADGYFDEALRKASQRFINRVKDLVNRPDLDGSGLIEKTFSSKSPLLAFNNRETPIERDEHDGYRFLAAGLSRALRNVVTHHDNYGLDGTSAWEWLVFVSAMHRRLDQAEQVAEEPDPLVVEEQAD